MPIQELRSLYGYEVSGSPEEEDEDDEEEEEDVEEEDEDDEVEEVDNDESSRSTGELKRNKVIFSSVFYCKVSFVLHCILIFFQNLL